tara:strand:- start:1548 stop:1694 length:147 start_codon:yes stop_codon:yes gene_type:complete
MNNRYNLHLIFIFLDKEPSINIDLNKNTNIVLGYEKEGTIRNTLKEIT